jgi:hydroxyacylglutathione hydrolase
MPDENIAGRPKPMELRRRVVGPWSVNAYALVCTDTFRSVLVDPGAQPEELAAMLADSSPAAILITHSHPDHIGALEAMRRRFKVPVMAHAAAAAPASKISADRWLANGDHVTVGHHRLEILHAPGHTPDQICFRPQGDRRVIVGDTIFDGGPGKTWSSEEFQQTLMTLKKVILPWPDETVCHPGHGNAFRLGDIRPRINGFLKKEHTGFFGDATWEQE